MVNPNVIVFRDVKNALHFVRIMTSNYIKVHNEERNKILEQVMNYIDQGIFTVSSAIEIENACGPDHVDRMKTIIERALRANGMDKNNK